MKKQYIKPTTTTVATITTAILAGSDKPGTNSNYSSTYGNNGQQGGENTDEIKSTDGYGDSDFTMGAKHNSFSEWDD